jgi:AcrR family transcriptional regulator
MAAKSSPTAEKPVDAAVIARIVAAARQHFFANGVRSVTMDDLARELGMSKKTLYACFPSKESLLQAVIDDKFQGMKGELEKIAAADQASFPEALRQLLACVQRQAAEIQPAMIRDLRLVNPDVFKRVEALRAQLIQKHFGRIFAQGQQAGMIRTDISAALMVQILLAAVQGIMNPAGVAALNLTPQAGISAIVSVVLNGVVVQPRSSGQ